MALNQEEIKSSRRFSFIDVPDPQNLKAHFMYNFFVPDERINSSGDSRVHGSDSWASSNIVQSKTVNSEVPRFIKIEWEIGRQFDYGGGGIASAHSAFYNNMDLGDIASESSLTTESFMTYSESDPDVRVRSKSKIEALSRLLGLTICNSDQSEILSQVTEVPKSNIQPIIAPSPSELIVNLNKEGSVRDLYTAASELKLNAQLNVRVIDDVFGGTDDVSGLSNVELIQKTRQAAKQAAQNFSHLLSAEDKEFGILPQSIEQFSPGSFAGDADIHTISHIGFVLTKTQIGPDGSKLSTEDKIILGKEKTVFTDTEIVYGSKYAYSVRNIYKIFCQMNFENLGNQTGQSFAPATFHMMSKASNRAVVETIDLEAPAPPDGLFYSFNYTRNRGLLLTWQFPTGRSRDVKYFQVFRRANIFEPFKCIAEIDFDNSVIRTERRESVRQDLMILDRGAQTFFEDSSFTKDSSPAIYAVCAVDAHSLTSGYSAQTEVSFNKDKNAIELKNISRPGAPKQYPNFFVDPDLDDNITVNNFTEDAIYDSGRQKIKVYFTPDALYLRDSEGQISPLLQTDQNNAVYKMHMINLDLQKSANVELRVDDKR